MDDVLRRAFLRYIWDWAQEPTLTEVLMGPTSEPVTGGPEGMVTPRLIQVGTRNYTNVLAMDLPNPNNGNACHKYEVHCVQKPGEDKRPPAAVVDFQDGPIKEAGINGCHNEDLMAIVIDRLQAFQTSRYACRENALALTKMEEALMWLRHRTEGRGARGVEGTHAV
jgi:hypothetical protein